jgi:hypothetical protein
VQIQISEEIDEILDFKPEQKKRWRPCKVPQTRDLHLQGPGEGEREGGA